MNGADRLRTAFLGIATRRIVAEYLRMLALVMFILLAIAWTIDLARHFAPIRQDAADRGLATLSILLPYLVYRGVDILVRLLPFAVFFGVFLAEILRRARLESVILAASGATPIRLAAPVLIFGAVVGTLAYKLEATWRPAAIEAQVALGHGDYAARFRPRWIDNVWFVSGDLAVRADLLRSDPPILRDALIFEGLKDPQLSSILAAAHLEPAGTDFAWQLRGVERWDPSAGGAASQPAEDIVLSLDILRDQVTHYGVPPIYLPTGTVERLRLIRNAPAAVTEAEATLWRRRLSWALPFAMALIAVALARRGYSGRQINLLRTIALGTLGFVAVVSVRVFRTVADLGGMPAPVAVPVSLLGLVLVATVLIWRET